ncbi:hypothetical protein Pcinc_032007 [Petrolisthes cinctipes]|uniref:type I protein arginine methyltransferase n=1 Tax=Petrolisthes cinctipes TaxID=88211 RepID=A0AAE1EVA9_PETCI|nr:hypothetical protein Pcinc_032007 [Petrolisthes cinctipes]
MPALEEDPSPPSIHHRTQHQLPSTYNSLVSKEVMACDSDGSEYEDEEEWEEIEESVSIKTVCLFCPVISYSVTTCLAHMIDAHGFDCMSFVCKFSLDQVGFIKLVNYVRKECPSPEDLIKQEKDVWMNNDYMKPVLNDDALLMYDIEELVNRSDEVESEYERSYKGATCEELQEIINKQREVMQRMLQAAQANSKTDKVWARTVGDMRPEEDEGYFYSYAHFDIHHEMLSDSVRTESYRAALLENTEMVRGKKVLDLGCGTGILSLFSAKAGATVTAVDMSDVLFQAIDIVRENKMESSITLLKGRLEDLNFEHHFDFIVSEWMGYFLLFEGMLDSVLHARDHHLAPGGTLLPNRCTMHLLGADDMDTYNKLVVFWDDVYGFKMSCMKQEVVKEASTDVVKSENIITTAAKIADFDLMKIQPSDTEFTTKFSLAVSRQGQITTLVGYFDTFFDLPHPVYFSTGPHAKPTHWKQTLFYLPKPKPVSAGEVLEGSISVRRKRREVRSLDVSINLDGQTLRYVVE